MKKDLVGYLCLVLFFQFVNCTKAPKKKSAKDGEVPDVAKQYAKVDQATVDRFVRTAKKIVDETFAPSKTCPPKDKQRLKKYVDVTQQCIGSDFQEKSASVLDQYLAYLKKLNQCGKPDPCKLQGCITKAKYESMNPSASVKEGDKTLQKCFSKKWKSREKTAPFPETPKEGANATSKANSTESFFSNFADVIAPDSKNDTNSSTTPGSRDNGTDTTTIKPTKKKKVGNSTTVKPSKPPDKDGNKDRDSRKQKDNKGKDKRENKDVSEKGGKATQKPKDEREGDGVGRSRNNNEGTTKSRDEQEIPEKKTRGNRSKDKDETVKKDREIGKDKEMNRDREMDRDREKNKGDKMNRGRKKEKDEKMSGDKKSNRDEKMDDSEEINRDGAGKKYGGMNRYEKSNDNEQMAENEEPNEDGEMNKNGEPYTDEEIIKDKDKNKGRFDNAAVASDRFRDENRGRYNRDEGGGRYDRDERDGRYNGDERGGRSDMDYDRNGLEDRYKDRRSREDERYSDREMENDDVRRQDAKPEDSKDAGKPHRIVHDEFHKDLNDIRIPGNGKYRIEEQFVNLSISFLALVPNVTDSNLPHKEAESNLGVNIDLFSDPFATQTPNSVKVEIAELPRDGSRPRRYGDEKKSRERPSKKNKSKNRDQPREDDARGDNFPKEEFQQGKKRNGTKNKAVKDDPQKNEETTTEEGSAKEDERTYYEEEDVATNRGESSSENKLETRMEEGPKRVSSDKRKKSKATEASKKPARGRDKKQKTKKRKTTTTTQGPTTTDRSWLPKWKIWKSETSTQSS